MRVSIKQLGFIIAVIVALAMRAVAQPASTGVNSPLQRTTPALELPDVGLDKLLELLSKTARMPLRVVWLKDGIVADTRYGAYLDGCTVEAALRAIFNRSPHVLGDEIVLGAAEAPGPIVSIQYSVGDLTRIASPQPGDGGQVLKELIERIVLTESWKDNGGADAELDCRHGTLFVNQTLEGQLEVHNALTALRSALPKNGTPINPEQAPVDEALDRSLGPAKFDATPLREVIRRLAKQAGANVLVNWSALESAGVGGDLPITADVTGVKLGTALRELLHSLQFTSIDFATLHGIILIDLSERLSRDIQTRSVDVSALLKGVERAHFTSQPAMSHLDAQDAFLKALEDNVDTESWKDNGGAVGSAQLFGDILVVQQSALVHREVSAFLAAFSEAFDDPTIAPAQKPVNQFQSTRIGAVFFDGTQFKNAIAQLESRSGAHLLICWTTLEAAGVDPAARIDVRLTDATLKTALDAVLAAAGAGQTRLAFAAVEDRFVVISTEESLSRKSNLIRFYRVQPMIDLMLLHQINPRGRIYTPTAQDAIDSLTRAVENNANPKCWKDNGGVEGTLHVIGNVMIINATPATHEQVEDVLKRLKIEVESAHGG